VRRKLLVVLLAAMMAVMTIVGASPAFAQTVEQQQYSDVPAGYCYVTPYLLAPC
jgi:hypothetical protein